jgi:uncharacterized protein
MLRNLLIAFALASATGCGSSPVAAQEQAVPALSGRVVDQANLISPAGEAALTAKLAALEADTSDQMVVVTLPDLEGETIEQTGLRLGNSWKLGSADLDNGVLLLVAPKERKVRIEVGLGLEALLTDTRAAEIIQKMLPQFKAQKFEQGIVLAVDEISTRLRSDRRRPQRVDQNEKAAA